MLRSHELNALLDAIDRLYQPVTPAEFPAHLFEVLTQLLPGTLHSFDSVELATGQVESHVTSIAATLAPVAQLEAAVREYAWQNPVVSHLSSHRTTVVQLSDLASHRQFRNTDFYRHCHLPLDIKHQVAASVAWAGHAGALVVNRGGSRGFTNREMTMIARLRPHVERAYHQALLVASLRTWTEKAVSGPLTNSTSVSPAVAALSARELEVLYWIAQGKRNSEIAVILGIAPRTVHKHVEHIFAKLGVETRTAAAASLQSR